MGRVRFDLTITTQTPLSIGAGGSSGTLADKTILRDGYGRPIIPGSQVKGKTRHAVEALLGALSIPVQKHFDDDDSPSNPVRDIFGSPRCCSPLRFADLRSLPEQTTVWSASESALFSPLRPSVAINRRRGVAEDQRLFLQETAIEGMTYHSANAITGSLDDQGYVALLWAALCLTTRWGGAKSRGLGWADITVRAFWREDEQRPSQNEDELSPSQLETALHSLVMRHGAR